MPIEWPGNVSSALSVTVLDNTGASPNILDVDLPCTVHITWTVPPGINQMLGGSFRLRAYAERIGPGPEIQIGGTVVVPVTPPQSNYQGDLTLPGNALLGEGQPFNGVTVSGVYKIVAVLQHLNPGVTDISGFAEATITMFRKP